MRITVSGSGAPRHMTEDIVISAFDNPPPASCAAFNCLSINTGVGRHLATCGEFLRSQGLYFISSSPRSTLNPDSPGPSVWTAEREAHASFIAKNVVSAFSAGGGNLICPIYKEHAQLQDMKAFGRCGPQGTITVPNTLPEPPSSCILSFEQQLMDVSVFPLVSKMVCPVRPYD